MNLIFTPNYLGKSRGNDGIIIGPDAPINGLKDALLLDKSVSRISSFLDSDNNISNFDNSFNISNPENKSEVANHAIAEGLSPNIEKFSNLSPAYQLSHCSYTDSVNLKGRLRLRSKGTSW